MCQSGTMRSSRHNKSRSKVLNPAARFPLYNVPEENKSALSIEGVLPPREESRSWSASSGNENEDNASPNPRQELLRAHLRKKRHIKGGNVGRRNKILPLSSRPAIVCYKQLKFLISDAPTDDNIAQYVDVLASEGCVAMVRTCEPSYDAARAVSSTGIKFSELPFKDGTAPSPSLLRKWLGLVNRHFKCASVDPDKSNAETDAFATAIGIHCVTGLGRAPLLVAIALVDWGMTATEAVGLVRSKRRGAINRLQMQFVEDFYKAEATTEQVTCGNICTIC